MVKRDIEATLLPLCRRARRLDAELFVAGARPAHRQDRPGARRSRATTCARTIRASRIANRREGRRASMRDDRADRRSARRHVGADGHRLDDAAARHHLCAVRRAQSGAGAARTRAPARIRLGASELDAISAAATRHLDGHLTPSRRVNRTGETAGARAGDGSTMPETREDMLARSAGEPARSTPSSSAAASTASASSANWRCRACACCWSSATTSARPAAPRRRA